MENASMNEGEVERIEFGSALFMEWIELRDRLLRAPLGLSLASEDLEREKTHHHFGFFHLGRLAGGLIVELDPALSPAAKIRQVAVSDELQSRGIGTELMRFAEEYIAREGASLISIHAREEVVPFYTKLGYEKVGERFIEVGIGHFRMEKRL